MRRLPSISTHCRSETRPTILFSLFKDSTDLKTDHMITTNSRQCQWCYGDLDTTNGMRGSIVDIVLDKDELCLPNANIVKLVYLGPARQDTRHSTCMSSSMLLDHASFLSRQCQNDLPAITVMIDGKPQKQHSHHGHEAMAHITGHPNVSSLQARQRLHL